MTRIERTFRVNRRSVWQHLPIVSKTKTYDARAIQVLEGLAAVRKRPGMYVGSSGGAGLHHLLWEAVDNGVDEFLAGFGTVIEVTLLADGGVKVRDYGRGMPVDPMGEGPHKGRSAAEVILTVLHAGGKFEDEYGASTGGLHGIGCKAITALSTRLDLVVRRDGRRWEQTFRLVDGKPGVTDGPLRDAGPSKPAERGTEITFWPDLSVFRDEEGHTLTGFSARTILERLETKSFVHAGLTFVFTDLRKGRDATPRTFRSVNGVADLVDKLAAAKNPLSETVVINGESEADKIQLSAAFVWTGTYGETTYGYSNGVYTPNGGTHVEGAYRALTRAVNRAARDKGVLKDRDDNPTGADVRQGLVAVVSLHLPNPSYGDQAKSKLDTPQARGAVESLVYEQFTRWMEGHPTAAKAICTKVAAAMRERKKSDEDRAADKALARKTGLKGSSLPDKLYDIAGGRGDLPTELFIVEGDSAGGTAVTARNPAHQAILPMRGKILNAENASASKVAKNQALAALIQALGCGRGPDHDISKIRYQRVIALADADVDGGHIVVLLATFFLRHMPDVIRNGHFHIAQPPLYSTIVRGEKVYLADDGAKAEFLAANPNHKAPFGRLKGLGEMDAPELRQTAMDPVTRRVVQVTIEDAIFFDSMISGLLGPSAATRLRWLLSGDELNGSNMLDAPVTAGPTLDEDD